MFSFALKLPVKSLDGLEYVDDLVVGEPISVDLRFHQCRRQIVAAVLAALLHHVGVVDQQLPGGGDRGAVEGPIKSLNTSATSSFGVDSWRAE